MLRRRNQASTQDHHLLDHRPLPDTEQTMRKTSTGVLAGVAGALLLSAVAVAQNDAPRSPWKYYPEDARANVGPGGPAPKRDLSGTWAGESSGAGVKPPVRPENPPPL